MNRVVVLVVLAAGLAGCVEGDSGAGVVGAALLPDLGEPFRFFQNYGAGEPNIAVASDGTLYVAAVVGSNGKANMLEGAAYLWRSVDDGATWDELRSPAPVQGQPDPLVDAAGGGFSCSCDADVVTSPDGWVYYTDWWIAGYVVGNFLVEASSDGGETWNSVPVTIPVQHGRAIDRQWLVAGDDGFVGLFYAYFGRDATEAGTDDSWTVEAVYSHDHGASWSEPVTAIPREGHHLHGHPFITDGAIVMPYAETDGHFLEAPGEVRVAISRDQGASWDHEVVAVVEDSFDNVWPVAGAADATGLVTVAWSERDDDEQSRVWVATSKDLVNWSEPHDLSGPGNHAVPWVAATGDGAAAVGWYGGPFVGEPTEAPDETEWHARLATTEDGWQTWATGLVDEAAVMRGGFCARGAACSSDRELLDYFSLAYDPAGALHVSFATMEPGVGYLAQVLYVGERQT